MTGYKIKQNIFDILLQNNCAFKYETFFGERFFMGSLVGFVSSSVDHGNKSLVYFSNRFLYTDVEVAV